MRLCLRQRHAPRHLQSHRTEFTAVTDSLSAGTYFAVAYAKNGVGTSYGDTIHFTILPQSQP